MITTPDLLAIRDPQVPMDVVLVLLLGVSAQLTHRTTGSSPTPCNEHLSSSLLKCDSEFFQTVTFLKVFSSQHYAILYIIVLGSLDFDILDLFKDFCVS